jgi:DNA invertase Pin-like site-specific DNA recombinase
MNDLQEEPTKAGVAVAYLRVASQNPADAMVSLESQWCACKDIARRNELRIIATYVDIGVSGLAAQRPGLDLMMSELSMGSLSVCWAPYVVMADTSRLARSARLLLALELQLARYRTRLVTALDGHMVTRLTRKENERATNRNQATR